MHEKRLLFLVLNERCELNFVSVGFNFKINVMFATKNIKRCFLFCLFAYFLQHEGMKEGVPLTKII